MNTTFGLLTEAIIVSVVVLQPTSADPDARASWTLSGGTMVNCRFRPSSRYHPFSCANVTTNESREAGTANLTVCTALFWVLWPQLPATRTIPRSATIPSIRFTASLQRSAITILRRPDCQACKNKPDDLIQRNRQNASNMIAARMASVSSLTRAHRIIYSGPSCAPKYSAATVTDIAPCPTTRANRTHLLRSCSSCQCRRPDRSCLALFESLRGGPMSDRSSLDIRDLPIHKRHLEVLVVVHFLGAQLDHSFRLAKGCDHIVFRIALRNCFRWRRRLVCRRRRWLDRLEMRVSVRLVGDRKSTRLNSSHLGISYAVFC